MEKNLPTLEPRELELFANPQNLPLVQAPIADFLGKYTAETTANALLAMAMLVESLPIPVEPAELQSEFALMKEVLAALHTCFEQVKAITQPVALLDLLREALAPTGIEVYEIGKRLVFEDTTGESLALEALPDEAQPYCQALIGLGYEITYIQKV